MVPLPAKGSSTAWLGRRSRQHQQPAGEVLPQGPLPVPFPRVQVGGQAHPEQSAALASALQKKRTPPLGTACHSGRAIPSASCTLWRRVPRCSAVSPHTSLPTE